MDSLAQEILQEIKSGKIILPAHIAIMLDGNGRWALRRGLPRVEGHRAGGENVKKIVRFCGEIGVRHLTLFGFSTENWQRPWEEVKKLLNLLEEYLITQPEELKANNVRLVSCGRIEEMPSKIQEALKRALEITKECRGLTLNLAINYGGRAEIVDSLNKMAREYQSGMLNLEDISPAQVKNFLYCPYLPFPDLLIRTSGEQRISNFLLWETSDAFFWITPTLWPDFSPSDLKQALLAFTCFRSSRSA